MLLARIEVQISRCHEAILPGNVADNEPNRGRTIGLLRGQCPLSGCGRGLDNINAMHFVDLFNLYIGLNPTAANQSSLQHYCRGEPRDSYAHSAETFHA